MLRTQPARPAMPRSRLIAKLPSMPNAVPMSMPIAVPVSMPIPVPIPGPIAGPIAMLIAMLIASGCGPQGDGARPLDDPAEADSWTLEPDPLLELGVERDGPAAQLFQRITRLSFVGDSSVAVVDGGALAYRVFGPDGAATLDIGRQGEGPGEFQAISMSAPRAGGGVVLVDERQGRATTVDVDGSIQEEPVPALEGELPLLLLATVGPRWFVGVHEMPPPASPAPGQLLALTGRHEIVTGDQSVEGCRLDIASNRFVGLADGTVVRMPLSPRPYFDSSVDFLAVADPSEGTLFVLREGGPWAGTPLPSYCEPVQPEAFRGEERSALRGWVPYDVLVDFLPDCLPSHDGLRITSNGLIWLRRSIHPGMEPELHRWDVLTEEGELQAVAEVPAAFTPFDMKDDRLLGRWIDEDGLHFIRIYTVSR